MIDLLKTKYKINKLIRLLEYITWGFIVIFLIHGIGDFVYFINKYWDDDQLILNNIVNSTVIDSIKLVGCVLFIQYLNIVLVLKSEIIELKIKMEENKNGIIK